MIKKLYFRIKNNRTLKNSLVMLSGGLLGSFTNYLYHLVVARSLGPKDYGLLDSLISILYQLTVPLTTITLVITRYVASFKGEGRKSAIESFYWIINKKLLFFAPFILIFFLILSPFIVKFLNLPTPFLFLWIAFSFILNLFVTVAKSFLQGLSKFSSLTLLGLAEGFLRLIFTVFLLYLGWGLMGAVFPFMLLAVFSSLISIYLMKNFLKNRVKEKIPEKKEIIKYIFPVFIVNLSLTLFITSDVILARHFLNAHLAGIYSAMSTLGKILFFATSPIIMVIFPITAETHSAKKNISNVLNTGILLILFIIFTVLAVFGLFPKSMVLLLFGEKYLEVTKYIFLFVLGMSFYTGNAAISNILLALKKVKVSILMALFAILHILLLIIFHKNITHFLYIFNGISAVLFLCLLVYYRYVRKEIALGYHSNL